MIRQTFKHMKKFAHLYQAFSPQVVLLRNFTAAAAESCPSKGGAKSTTSSNQSSQKPQPTPDIKIKHKFLVLSGKGGVGKSTISSQLALSLSQLGIQTGILDIDICGPNIPRMLGIENQKVYQNEKGIIPIQVNKNLKAMSMGLLISKNDAVVWRGPKKHQMIQQFLTQVQWGDLDCLIIDTPPGTSDEHITIVESVSSSKTDDGAIIVTTPQEVALSDVRKEITFCERSFINIVGVVENMSGFVCPNCKTLHQIFPANTGGADALCAEFKLKLLARIPLDPSVLQSTEEGQHVKSASATEFQKITTQLINDYAGLRERMKVLY